MQMTPWKVILKTPQGLWKWLIVFDDSGDTNFVKPLTPEIPELSWQSAMTVIPQNKQEVRGMREKFGARLTFEKNAWDEYNQFLASHPLGKTPENQ